MVDEAFALSPISARAVQPGEEDYEAISQAFMETSRGRWFLGEYAKRNRNADTRMVLDAVARIEETIAAQNLTSHTLAAQNLATQQPPVPNTELADALAALRQALGDARAAAESAIEELAVEPHLAPIRKGIRVIREISWRWREIGADARICDLIDSQLLAIEGGCEHIAAIDPKAALSPAFDLILQRITALDEGDRAAAAPDPTETVAPARSDDGPPAASFAAVSEADHAHAGMASLSAAAAPEPEAAAEPDLGRERDLHPGLAPETDLTVEPELTAEISVASAEVATAARQDPVAEPVDVAAEAKDIMAEIAEMSDEPEDGAAAAAAAQDEAVLQRVAFEMAAPDDGRDDEPFEGDDAAVGGAASAAGQPILMAPQPEPAPTAVLPPAPQPAALAEPSAQRSPPPAPQPASPISLGSSLIASGIVRRPMSETDPLAPIRRMSQAEKIAFFS